MSIKETIQHAGQKIADGAEQAADWVKDKTGMSHEGADLGTAKIRERMDVIGSCGNKLGVVDHIEGGAIKLTRKDSPDGEHHFIPMSWVDHVDSHVHLNKNCGEARQSWMSAPMGAGI
ncbi:MAG TPA: DUF2171 domain-containing protein [Gemmataceae bacterium]|nr:DUF2171 domain-containing protein [Gemmataceae bacterium]